MGNPNRRPQPGDIVLLRIRGVVGWLVWLMQAINGDVSRWTHVGIMLTDERIFEAQPGGAVITPWSDYLDRPWTTVAHKISVEGHRVALALTEGQRFDITRRAHHYVGVGYNWGTYLYLALWRLGFKRAAVRVRDNKRLICSQAADLIYYDLGIDLFPGHDPYDMTPGDFAQLAA